MLGTQKLLPSLISEGDEMLYSRHFCRLSFLLFLLFQQRLLLLMIFIVESVIKFVHLLASAVRVIPDELLRLIELSVLG